MSKFVDFLRRSFVVFVTCVITVISMAVAISPSVSAAGVFSPFNFYQLYQMLHGLLLGDGGGNSQTFGEWLEENMTRTVGSGNSKKEFLITPGMKLSDMMTQASLNLVLGAALSDGGIAGTSKIKDLIDSWTEVYDTSDIGEIGESSSSGGYYPSGISCSDGVVRFSSNFFVDHKGEHFPSDNYPYFDISTYKSVIRGDYLYLFCVSNNDSYIYYVVSVVDGNVSVVSDSYSYIRIRYSFYDAVQSTGYLYSSSNHPISSPFSSSVFCSMLDGLGCAHFSSFSDAVSIVNSASDWVDKSSTGESFIGPAYAMPAAKQLITDTGTLSGLRLDVQTDDGTPDISAALDHAGVDNVNDLVAGVAAGTIPMSQVYDDMRVVPYVLTDVDTGEIVTDLNVSATDAKTKAVALDKDLSIPKDISAVDAYQITGKTWDPSLSKYKLPLFDFFPFCLPYDAYQFLTMLDVTPVAPVFQVDTTPLFSHTRFFHAADGYNITLDLTKYEEVFQILRAGECLAIVVGLCLISYKLIHGGD